MLASLAAAGAKLLRILCLFYALLSIWLASTGNKMQFPHVSIQELLEFPGFKFEKKKCTYH